MTKRRSRLLVASFALLLAGGGSLIASNPQLTRGVATRISRGEVPLAAAATSQAHIERPRRPTAVAATAASGTAAPQGEPAPSAWLDPLRCSPIENSTRFSCQLCVADHECDPGTTCALDRDRQEQRCVGSDCQSDYDCAAGWSCRTLNDAHTVRRCIEGGTQRDGQPCAVKPIAASWSCQEGLQCVRGRCALPCSPEHTCGSHADCVDAADGPVCVPKSCRLVGCPKDQACTQVGANDYQCTEQTHGTNCFETPCAKGLTCEALFMMGLATYQCVAPCSPLARNACPRGFTCGMSHMRQGDSVCYHACTRDEGGCPEGLVCGTVSEDLKTWGCVSMPEVSE